LGGVDKENLRVAGRTFADRVLEAVGGADRIISVGRPLPGVGNVREEPLGGGPVAAIAAGLACVEAGLVVVLATDLPVVTAPAVGRLLSALYSDANAAAAFPVDAEGRDQPLCSAWRAGRLRAALAGLGDPSGAPVRSLVARAEPVVRLRDVVDPASNPPWFDCDTPADVAEAERLLGLRPQLRQQAVDGGDAPLG
jgi:molybdopterin-guanine dinucleotide biosynthesis protein A